MISRTGTFQLLLIEDNQADVDLIKILLGNTDYPITLTTLDDGEKASDFLFKRGAYADRTGSPDLIIMDLNVPRKDGRALLAELKSHPELRRIPVVVLSSSNSDRDVSECYSLGASVFITKSIDLEEFENAIATLTNLFFRIASLSRAT